MVLPLLAFYCILARRATSGKRGDDLFAEQLHRLLHQRRWHAPDLVVRAEDVVAHPLPARFELIDDRVRAADERQALLDVELVALGRHSRRLAALLVVL